LTRQGGKKEKKKLGEIETETHGKREKREKEKQKNIGGLVPDFREKRERFPTEHLTWYQRGMILWIPLRRKKRVPMRWIKEKRECTLIELQKRGGKNLSPKGILRK